MSRKRGSLEKIVLNEGLIKAAVIDRLIDTGALQDAVLINEMVVANWSRRVDLAVANGRLHAFEIKSDLDTLRRLQDQVTTYLSRFDKVTVVTTSKFIDIVKVQLPPQTELWEAYAIDGHVELRVVRRGKVHEVKGKRVLCGFLLKTELVSFLRMQGCEASVEWPRENLIRAVDDYALCRLRQFVLDALKARYRNTFKAFLDWRKTRTNAEDLSKLSKSKLAGRISQQITPSYPQACTRQNPRTLNLIELEKRYGELPQDMPLMVLRRIARDR